MTSVIELPPDEVIQRGSIDRESIERIEWYVPIWTCEVGGERVVIAAKGGRNFLLSDASLQWEAALLDGLEGAGFPSSRTARIFDGSDHTFVDGRHYVARTWVPGRMLAEFDNPDLFAVGRFVAEYHAAASTIALPQRDGFTPLEDVLLSVDDAGMRRVLGDEQLVHKFRACVDAVVPSIAGVGTSMPVHGDFTTRNIAANDPSTFTGLIDFGMAHAACPAVELAYAVGSARPTYDHVEYDLDRVTTFVRGYCSIGTLDADDPARIVGFAEARPLLGLAFYAFANQPPPDDRRTEGSFGRTRWIADHRDELIAAIEAGIRGR